MDKISEFAQIDQENRSLIEELKSQLLTLNTQLEICKLQNDLINENNKIRLENEKIKSCIIEQQLLNGDMYYSIPSDCKEIHTDTDTITGTTSSNTYPQKRPLSPSLIQNEPSPKLDRIELHTMPPVSGAGQSKLKTNKNKYNKQLNNNNNINNNNSNHNFNPNPTNLTNPAATIPNTIPTTIPTTIPATIPTKTNKITKTEQSQPKVKEAAVDIPDISRVDFRIGIIKEVSIHPTADTLYIEKIDCGDSNGCLRTVISGLVGKIPIDQMEGRTVIVCCNLKPRNMRGINSEAMVMCACKQDEQETTEFIDPPIGSLAGEPIIFEGYKRMPDEILPPKKKIMERVLLDLHTDDNCIAKYKNVSFEVINRGVCKAQTLCNVIVK